MNKRKLILKNQHFNCFLKKKTTDGYLLIFNEISNF